MKLLLAFTPFHTPASPPFGLACLKGALAQSRPQATVTTVDWNLAFFRRWLRGEMPDLCHLHPTHLLGAVCPSLIASDGLGQRLLEDLTRLPRTAVQLNATSAPGGKPAPWTSSTEPTGPDACERPSAGPVPIGAAPAARGRP